MRGDRELAEALLHAGYEPAGDNAPADVVILGAADAQGVAAAGRELAPGALLAVPARSPGPGADQGRAARAAAGLDPRPGLHAVRVGRALRRTGLRVWRLETGAPARRHRVWTVRAPKLPPRPGRRPVVLASSAVPETALESALAAAAAGLGAPLGVAAVHVLAGGALMAEVDPAGLGPHLLRLAGGPAAGLVARGAAVQRELQASPSLPPQVRDRLLLPVAEGSVGPLAWTLEPRAPGRHPDGLTPELLDDCLEFLVGLRAVAVAAASYDPAPDVAALEPHLDAPARAALGRVGAALAQRLAAVALGWGHGDFWASNLLTTRGALATVLDWDSGGPAHLPMLDLMHLLAHAEPDLRRRSHGARCVERLWPSARRGGDATAARYLSNTGTPADPATVESLAVAYWLTRAARDLRTFADRSSRPRWMDANVLRPLAALEEVGW